MLKVQACRGFSHTSPPLKNLCGRRPVMSAMAKKQSGPRPNDSISELPYATLQRLGNRLDMPCAGNQLYWRRLIEVMPEGMYDQLTVNRFAMNAGRLDGSPGYALLTDMGNRGVTFQQLVTYLKSMKFDVALRELGYKGEPDRLTCVAFENPSSCRGSEVHKAT